MHVDNADLVRDKDVGWDLYNALVHAAAVADLRAKDWVFEVPYAQNDGVGPHHAFHPSDVVGSRRQESLARRLLDDHDVHHGGAQRRSLDRPNQ
jgi:hypothetical protein